MEFILLAILVIVVAVVIYGTLSRRKIYKDVDRLENWKIELGSRPVAEEIAKVKGLKISGETEEKFELWRKDWDDIVGTHIPDIEKALFDIEEQANKYRFGKARELVTAVENQLQDIEAQIDVIFKEVDELVHSEKENEAGISETQAKFDAMSRHLLQHSLSLGKTAPVFEERKMEMKQALVSFEEDREAGNYTSARQTLKQVDHDLEVQNAQMKEIPVLLKDLDMELPSELRELQRGVENMEGQGYPLGHLSLYEQIEEYKQELPALKESCEEFELEKVKDRIEEIRSFMEATYEMLEKEVDARGAVQAEIPQLEEQLRKLKEKLADLQREEAKVEVSYLIPMEDKEQHDRLAVKMDDTIRNWRLFQDANLNRTQTFSEQRSQLEKHRKEWSGLTKEIQQLKDRLYTLRKDEKKALDTFASVKRQLLEDEMLLQRSFMPRIPSPLLNDLDDADENVKAAEQTLDEVPVEIARANADVDEADKSVRRFHQRLIATLEQVRMAELAIQYGNRYRSSDEELHEQFKEAEKHFHKGRYDDAVNTAVGAMEKKNSNIREVLLEFGKQ